MADFEELSFEIPGYTPETLTELYTDDRGLANCARLCGVTPISLYEVPVPNSAKQGKFHLEPHEDLPKPDDELSQASPEQA